MEINLQNLKLFARGKVRDTFDLGERLLMVASDRISAYDVVMPNGIPGKGKILTQLSAFWFGQTSSVVPNHLIAVADEASPAGWGKGLPISEEEWALLSGRTMLVKKAERIDIECVVRGYLAGSAWEEYSGSGTVCGLTLPAGLRQSEKLPEPIFTPATKAFRGHDENISFERMAELVGGELASKLRTYSLAIYRFAETRARVRGIIIADTKMEFGLLDGKIILIDELLTPDSSRFWPASDYQVGVSPPSFDKQFLRDWLCSSGWNKEPPAPQLPPEIVAKTAKKYQEAYRRLVRPRRVKFGP